MVAPQIRHNRHNNVMNIQSLLHAFIGLRDAIIQYNNIDIYIIVGFKATHFIISHQ